MQTIRGMARLIAQRFDVEQVILFGSYATGQAHEDSDVDLLVIMPPAAAGAGRAAPILAALGRHFAVPVDVFVRTEQGVERFKDARYSLVHQALKGGVTLYAR